MGWKQLLLRRSRRIPRRDRGARLKAVQVGEPGTVRVTDVPEPRLQDPRDAVGKVTATAIGGADRFPVHGMTPGVADATVLGHAFVGAVADGGASRARRAVGR